MKLTNFFIDRPIFAAVLSAFITIAGAIALFQLPISEYPEVVPPSVVVRAAYPGANPKVVADTVAAPLEQEIVGVEDMLYMSSQTTMDGSLALTVTFTHRHRHRSRAGAGAEPRLPGPAAPAGGSARARRLDGQELRRSHDGRASSSRPTTATTLCIYATTPTLNIRDVLARLPGMGEVRVFGARRLLDARVARSAEARRAQSHDRRRRRRDPRTERAGGGRPDRRAASERRGLRTRLERAWAASQTRSSSATSSSRPEPTAKSSGCAMSRVSNSAPRSTRCRACSTTRTRSPLPVFQAPGSNALELSTAVRNDDGEAQAEFPGGRRLRQSSTTRRVFVRQSIDAVVHTLLEAILLVVLVVILFLQTWRASIIPLVAVPVSIIGTFAVLLGVRLLDQHAVAVRSGAGHRHRGGRRHRGRRERRASHRATASLRSTATKQAMSEVSRPIIAITLVLCAVFVPGRVRRAASPASSIASSR